MINISVIIPVFNTEKYLAECIDSVLSQREDTEIILVDGNSTDRSGEICDEYALKNKRVKAIHKSGYVGIARNIGLEYAQGKYIYFADSDDLLVPNALTRMYDEAEKYDLDILRLGAENFTDIEECRDEISEQSTHFIPHVNDEKVLSGIELLEDSIQRGEFVSAPWAHFYKRSFLQKNSFEYPDVRWHEDTCTTFYIWLAAEKAKRITDVLYQRRMRPESLSHKKVYPVSFDIYSNECFRLIDLFQNSIEKTKLHKVILLETKRVLNHAVLIYRECEKTDKERMKIVLNKLSEQLKKLGKMIENIQNYELISLMIKIADNPEDTVDNDKSVYLL